MIFAVQRDRASYNLAPVVNAVREAESRAQCSEVHGEVARHGQQRLGSRGYAPEGTKVNHGSVLPQKSVHSSSCGEGASHNLATLVNVEGDRPIATQRPQISEHVVLHHEGTVGRLRWVSNSSRRVANHLATAIYGSGNTLVVARQQST